MLVNLIYNTIIYSISNPLLLLRQISPEFFAQSLLRLSTDGRRVDQDPIFLSAGRGRNKRISGRFVHARNSSVFTQSLSISEASQVNISAIGTPTVVKLTLLTPIKMTNIFIFMVLFTKVHSEVRKWRKSSFFVDFEKSRNACEAVKLRRIIRFWIGWLLQKPETILHLECHGFARLGGH